MRSLAFALLSLTALLISAPALTDDRAAEAPSGQAVFETSCANCHTGGFGGFFTGAPKLGKQSDWEALVTKGVDGLTASTIAGIGDMEARGGCTSCTDADIRAAVEHMLAELD